jgi:hypothetical protein
MGEVDPADCHLSGLSAANSSKLCSLFSGIAMLLGMGLQLDFTNSMPALQDEDNENRPGLTSVCFTHADINSACVTSSISGVTSKAS